MSVKEAINLDDYDDFSRVDDKFDDFVLNLSKLLVAIVDLGFITKNTPIPINEFFSIKKHNSGHSQYFIVKKDDVKLFGVDITHMMPHQVLLYVKHGSEDDIRQALKDLQKWIKEKYPSIKIG